MVNSAIRRSTSPAVPRLHVIRSPLTRVAYGLDRQDAHLILLNAGSARLEPDGEIIADEERLVWLAEGDGRELLVDAGARGRLLALPRPALLAALPTSPLGEQIRRTLGQRLSVPLPKPDRVNDLLTDLERELSSHEPGSDLAVAYHSSLLLLQLWRKARADLIAHGHAPQGLAERFVLLAQQNMRRHWSIDAYARTLGVSRDRLGTAVRRATGHSPQAYLHQGLVRAACQLLADTGMPVTQVGFRLGFADPAYFTRFFSRMTGVPPGRFRKSAKARRAKGIQSYAAWP